MVAHIGSSAGICELLVVLGKASGQKYSLPCSGKSDTFLCVCRMCVWCFIDVLVCIFSLPSVHWCCWLGIRKSNRPFKKLSDEVLAWLPVWLEPSTNVLHMVQLMPLLPPSLVHGQVTIIFVVSVGLSVCLFVCLCRVFLSRLWSDFDQTRTYVICLGLVVYRRIYGLCDPWELGDP